jgi:DNA-binding NarL/FixJ family response regulator
MAALGSLGDSRGVPMADRQEISMPHAVHINREREEGGSAPIRVLVAEGQGLVRAAFRVLLERHAGIAVAAEAATGDEAVAAALRVRPDVVLMDIALPGLDGLEATRQIVADTPPGETAVLMLMTGVSDEAVFAALRAGAAGLMLKDTDADALVDAVQAAADGDAPLAPRLARRLVADFLARPERLRSSPEALEELTPREREVVALVACGLSNEEIAERLVVTRATAKTHVSRALCKLHARDRAQLVVLAYEAGLVRPGPRWPDVPDAAVASAAAVSRLPRSAHVTGGRRWQPVAA